MDEVQKIYLVKAGNHGRFELRKSLENRALAAEHIRIAVHYSGINFADVMMGLGMYPDAPKLPYIPGYELSGVVTALGEEVSDFYIGQQVCAASAFGAMQSSVDLPKEQVIGLPSSLNMKQGAALIVSFITAYATFIKLARVTRSDRVLIDCGTGALGRTSIELLQHLGVGSISALTRSVDKLKYLKEMGVEALTHNDLSLNHSKRSFDIVLNSRGGRSLREDYKRLSPCGKIICIGASSLVTKGSKSLGRTLREMWGMRAIFPISLMNDNRGIMGLNALRLFDEQKIIDESFAYLKVHCIFKPRVDKVFSAPDVAEAIDYLAKGHSRGKVLLKW